MIDISPPRYSNVDYIATKKERFVSSAFSQLQKGVVGCDVVKLLADQW